MSDPLSAFPAFIEAVRTRLEAGRAAYGDRSFDRPTSELLGELQQEALDLAGWGFILFDGSGGSKQWRSVRTRMQRAPSGR